MLKHLEEHILQSNMKSNDIMMYFTTVSFDVDEDSAGDDDYDADDEDAAGDGDDDYDADDEDADDDDGDDDDDYKFD